MKRTAIYTLFLAGAMLALAAISAGQGASGTPPFGSFGGGPFDTVNLGNLNVHFAVPIRHKAGRGTPFTYDVTYDNSVWYPGSVNGVATWQPAPIGYWGWRGLTTQGALSGLTYSVQYSSGNCGQTGTHTWQSWQFKNLVYSDNQGSHSVTSSFSPTWLTVDGGINIVQNCPPPGAMPSTQAVIPFMDGSGLTFYGLVTGQSSLSWNVTTASGTNFNTGGGGGSTDANGNQITVNNGVLTDTLGQTALTVAGSPPSNTTLSYSPPSGGTATYTVSYRTYTVKTNFGCSGIVEYNLSQSLPDKITLPDGTFYQLTYEPTPGGISGQVTARIASVALPTGGSITYAYTGANNGIVCADGTAAGLTRTLNGGTWNYSRALQSAKHWQTTITDPTTAANQTLIDMQQDNSSNTVNFFETQRKSYQGSTAGTLLSTAITCYNTANPTPSSCAGTAVSTPITRVTAFSNLPDSSGKVSEMDTQYAYISDPGYPTEVDSYDYGTGGPLTPPIQKVITQYSAYGSVVQPTSVQVQDGSGVVKANTTYGYDETAATTTTGTPQHTTVTGGRGNLTTLATQASGTVTLYRKFTNFDTGTLNTATDRGTTSSGGPNVTTFNYPNATSTCGNAFPTSVSEPLSMSRSFAWDCNGAAMTSVTDENGKVSTVYYTGTNFNKTADPSYWRPYATTDQLGNPTTFSYPSAIASESTMAFNSHTSVADHRTTLDGFGRPHVNQTEQGYNAANYDSTETDYDVAGRTSRTTVPYSAAAGSTCSGCAATTTTYDALNRPLIFTDGGGGTLTFTYTKNDVYQAKGPAPTGENAKRKQLEYDVLGRISSVCEITGGTGSGSCAQASPQTGYWTKYTYDTLGDLTSVAQNAQGTPQNRTYAFDMLGRMTSEQNPETSSLATTYVYDSWDASCGSYSSPGDLVEKKDAVGNVTCLKYDGLHRAIQSSYPSGSYAARTPMKCYVYDAATVNGTVMGNTKDAIGRGLHYDSVKLQ